jgi:hypothetical protein
MFTEQYKMKIKDTEYNILTGEETITERDETPAEIKARLDRAEEVEKEQAENAAKEAARKAVLDKLGLTADEVAALGL